MQIRTALAAAAFALTLGGCWLSEKPLMGASARDTVDLVGTWSDLGDGGSTPTVYRLVPGDDRELIAQTKGDSGWKTEYIVGLDWLDSDTYLLQAVEPDGGVAYELLLGDPARNELKLVKLDCTEQVLAASSEIKSEDGDCTFTSYAVLREQAEKAAEQLASGDESVAESIVTYHRVED